MQTSPRKPTLDSMVADSTTRLKRKIELFELKVKSSVTAAEVAAELGKMRDGCKKLLVDWFNKGPPSLGATLVSKVAARSPVCSVQDVVKLLMQGVDVEQAEDALGRSALHWAVQTDNVPVASLLIDCGAAVERSDLTRTLPMHVAAAVCTSGLMCSLLLESSLGSSLMMQNCGGWTALHVAAFTGNQAVLRLLLAQKGVDLSMTDAEGATPLHAAVGAGQLECARVLVTRGANVNAKAGSGDTPLHFAARMGHSAIAAMLVKMGADRWQKNDSGIACVGMPGFAKHAIQAEKEMAESAPGDPDLPLKLPIPATVPEARSHHFIVDEKAVEAVAGTFVTSVLRTSPPRLGLRFVTQCRSSFDTAETHGWTMDHHNGSYSVTYRQPPDDKAEVTVALVEGGQVVAKRSFAVTTVAPRVVGRFCVAFGAGLYDPQPGANSFIVRTRNQCGTNMEKGGAGESIAAAIKVGTSMTKALVRDLGNGLYAVGFNLPDSGIVEMDVLYQGQSIAGFPVKVNMDQQAKVATLFSMRKIEEEIVFYQKKLESVDKSVETGSPAARRHVTRKCVACLQREVCALLLPCRHYRYCAACASGFTVLETPCKVCKEASRGYLIVNP